MLQWRRLWAGGLLAALLGSEAFALSSAGIGNEVISARSSGQGMAGIAAQNDDPSVVYANPAGLTKLKGTQMTVGGVWENLHATYEDDSGGKAGARSSDIVFPNVAVTRSLMDGRAGMGLCIVAPYGAESHWPGGSPVRYAVTNTRLRLLDLSPAFAFQVRPALSLGFGADYFKVLDSQMDKHIAIAGAPDGNASLTGTGDGFGYHAGLLYQPTQKHAVGLAYHSKVKIRLDGEVRLNNLSGLPAFLIGAVDYWTPAYTDIFLPQNIQLGYAYKPNDQWVLEADAAWYDSSVARDLNVRVAETDPLRLAVINASNPQQLNWSNTWNFAVGANYKRDEQWQFRGGFYVLPCVAPEATFSPGFLDLTRYGLAGGLGYQMTKSLGMDMAYNAIFTHNRHVTNTLGSGTINGLYGNFVNLVAMNLTYRL